MLCMVAQPDCVDDDWRGLLLQIPAAEAVRLRVDRLVWCVLRARGGCAVRLSASLSMHNLGHFQWRRVIDGKQRKDTL